ncbi:hypothetical protein Daura_39880 [Dactylosporangium aurantiacum]|uniref:Uncharacterized protein n=1 Tax=Dactylosporangium aurantiacum TaxID=35754 RepID=A0A9Q9IEU5_9ACTN|nr:hypothetical protein [Dactylosporangium aurantiacum]MDG6101414.1 hypothetical protein [Dactylosporangium aurantiacum]UWZ52732.1 hypothetical protein Daura_39880 [Dactylosporangium aurantiacum]
MSEDAIKRFERGRRRGRDPVNTGADGVAVTTTDSLWLADYCECGHTFRQGDPVYVEYGPPLVVRHHSPALPCSRHVEGGGQLTDDGSRASAFHKALDAANPPPQGTLTERLLPGHPLLVDVRPRLHCAFCSKTFRPYEMAVICPCSLEAPKCRLGVHRDPGRGNDCYDAWVANGPLVRCPTSFQKVQ